MQHPLFICGPAGAFSGGSGSHERLSHGWHISKLCFVFKLWVALILIPAKSASNLCLLSQSRFLFLLMVCLFFLTLELVSFCFKSSVNLWCHWYGSSKLPKSPRIHKFLNLGQSYSSSRKQSVDLRVLFLSSYFQMWWTKHCRDDSWSVHGLLVAYWGLQIKVKFVKLISRCTLCIDTSGKS